jgi:glutamyl-tRNA reductase
VTHLLLVGVSHHTAPVEIRERLDFLKGDLPRALGTLADRPSIGEAVVLSTCNRVELYVTCEEVSRAREELAGFLSRFHNVSEAELMPCLYTRVDEDSARHLFRVSAGLDSLVVGEPQILGQVKDAYAVASELHATGPLLNRLFHSAFAVGKRVRSETGLAEGAVSVSYAAVSLARKIFGDLKDLNVLVIGAGEMAKLTAIHLKSQHVRRMEIMSRTTAHAESLAAKIGAQSVAWTVMNDALLAADIVVTATGAVMPILSRARVADVMRRRGHRPLFLIDIAVPRDVEAATGSLEQVFLYNIDDLQSIVSENLSRRSDEVHRADAIVAEEVQRFAAWLRSRDAIPTVVALRQRFEAVRQAELKRLEPKLVALPPEARARVDEITRLIVEKLLLTPTEQLKAIGDQDTVAVYADALNRLFSLVDDDMPRRSPKTPVRS